MTFDFFIGISVVLLGLVMGSAVTALAWRVPRGESWVHGRSRCPKCGHVLGVADLFPVLSWAVNRGRCRHCGVGVSARYPLTELLCAAWAFLAWQKLGLTPAFPLVAFWGFLLVALLWIDLDFQLLPDALTLPGTLLGIGAALLGPGARHAMFGMLAGAGLLWLVAELYFRVRKVEGLGGGDVKLAAMFGAVLGGPLALLTIFLAALGGTVWAGVLLARGKADGRTPLPFGTMLAPAAMVVFLWGEPAFRWYLGLLGR
ncbi:MAG: prepilin peptidase [Candidatus Eisenbacteria bacterium]|nr:prepilin peptidase [Candidatus Eisenbacteria bacterium]